MFEGGLKKIQILHIFIRGRIDLNKLNCDSTVSVST